MSEVNTNLNVFLFLGKKSVFGLNERFYRTAIKKLYRKSSSLEFSCHFFCYLSSTIGWLRDFICRTIVKYWFYLHLKRKKTTLAKPKLYLKDVLFWFWGKKQTKPKHLKKPIFLTSNRQKSVKLKSHWIMKQNKTKQKL